VIGASGGTGIQVVKGLQAAGIPVVALTRNPESAETLKGEGVTVLVGNSLLASSLQQALAGIKYVISTMGTRHPNDLEDIEAVEHQYMVTLVEVAAQAGVEHLVHCTSLGSDAPERFPYLLNVLKGKQKGEQVLINSGLTYTIVRPGGLNNNPGGDDVLVKAKLQDSGFISREDVAQVMIQALLQPEARNKIFEIISKPGEGPANRPGLFVE
jgi:uncharacterized protein YbjT (DUF2867 family)